MLAKIRATKAEDSGFTLVELLVVIAILGVLAGVAVFSVAGVQDDSQNSACKAENATVRTAEEAHYAKKKLYATGAELKTAQLLHKEPSLVTITVTGAGAGYTLAYASVCSGAGAV
jgi:general secretion pathway protein G